MITTCSGCQARYRLDGDRVPPRKVRVRCPECQTVFELDGGQREPSASAASPDMTMAPAAAPVAGTPPAPVPPPAAEPADAAPDAPQDGGEVLRTVQNMPQPAEVEQLSGLEGFEVGFQTNSASPFSPSSDAEAEADVAAGPGPLAAPASDPDPAPASAAQESATATAVATADPPRSGGRRRRAKEEMLARALVSDILVYNREVRDKALADGNLLEALGPEIKKSWELYKEKVGAETANGTPHFRDALNEILAEGQKVF